MHHVQTYEYETQTNFYTNIHNVCELGLISSLLKQEAQNGALFMRLRSSNIESKFM